MGKVRSYNIYPQRFAGGMCECVCVRCSLAQGKASEKPSEPEPERERERVGARDTVVFFCR